MKVGDTISFSLPNGTNETRVVMRVRKYPWRDPSNCVDAGHLWPAMSRKRGVSVRCARCGAAS